MKPQEKAVERDIPTSDAHARLLLRAIVRAGGDEEHAAAYMRIGVSALLAFTTQARDENLDSTTERAEAEP